MSSINKYKTSRGETRYTVRYTKPDGRRTQKRFRTLAEAKAWQHRMETEKRAGTFVPVSAGRIRFEHRLVNHLRVNAGLSDNTRYQRESVAKKWLLPKWGELPVNHITRHVVELWIEELVADGVGTETIQKAYRLFNATLNRAVDDHVLQRNPAQRIKLPRSRSAKRHPYLTFEELAELNDAMDPRYRTLVVFLALTGLRFGEAAALRVMNVDLKGRLVYVDSAVKEVAGRLSEGDTKTHTIRTIAYPPVLDSAVGNLLAGRRPDDRLFTSPTGKGLRINTWRRRFWYPALERLQARRDADATLRGEESLPFPDVTPHDLRHTAASLAIRAGADISAVARMLGHADTRMTLNTYAGLLTSDLTAVAATLQRDMAGSALETTLRGSDTVPDVNP